MSWILNTLRLSRLCGHLALVVTGSCSHRCSTSTLWTVFWLASLGHFIEPAVKSVRRQDRTSDFLLHPTTHSIWQWLNRLNQCKFRQSQTEVASSWVFSSMRLNAHLRHICSAGSAWPSPQVATQENAIYISSNPKSTWIRCKFITAPIFPHPWPII